MAERGDLQGQLRDSGSESGRFKEFKDGQKEDRVRVIISSVLGAYNGKLQLFLGHITCSKTFLQTVKLTSDWNSRLHESRSLRFCRELVFHPMPLMVLHI